MSHVLKHRVKDDKWRLWTTISDGWLTEWLTADDMKHELAEQYQTDYRVKVIEAFWTFPHGYYDKDTRSRHTNYAALEAFTEWHLAALRSDDYYAALDSKFTELTGVQA